MVKQLIGQAHNPNVVGLNPFFATNSKNLRIIPEIF
jgi:hypothetical protein